MKFKGVFSDDPTKAMPTKDIDRQTSRLKYIAAIGGCVSVGLAIALGSLKLANELKK
jgi:hypothetical protein